jgi:ribonuclease I
MIFVHGREKPEELVFLDKEKTLDRRQKSSRFIRENPSTNEKKMKYSIIIAKLLILLVHN